MKPERKHPRLKVYDYSLPGYYHVTICVADDSVALSRIEPGEIRLTKAGTIARKQLLALEQRYSYVRIDKYVIMPNHIHVIIRLLDEKAQKKRPDVTSIVGSFKSLTTRLCNDIYDKPGKKWFQTSFYDEILRNERAYQECWRYIDENPLKWLLEPEERS